MQVVEVETRPDRRNRFLSICVPEAEDAFALVRNEEIGSTGEGWEVLRMSKSRGDLFLINPLPLEGGKTFALAFDAQKKGGLFEATPRESKKATPLDEALIFQSGDLKVSISKLYTLKT